MGVGGSGGWRGGVAEEGGNRAIVPAGQATFLGSINV